MDTNTCALASQVVWTIFPNKGFVESKWPAYLRAPTCSIRGTPEHLASYGTVVNKHMQRDLQPSSSLNGLESAISSGGIVNPVKENEKPKLALEARLRAAPLFTSSNSILIWALLHFLMCGFLLLPLPLRPGDGTIRLLDFLCRDVPPLSTDAATVSTTDWSDFALANTDELVFSMLTTVWYAMKYRANTQKQKVLLVKMDL